MAAVEKNVARRRTKRATTLKLPDVCAALPAGGVARRRAGADGQLRRRDLPLLPCGERAALARALAYDVTCGVCDQLYIDPVRLSCGHVSCRWCACEWVAYSVTSAKTVRCYLRCEDVAIVDTAHDKVALLEAVDWLRRHSGVPELEAAAAEHAAAAVPERERLVRDFERDVSRGRPLRELTLAMYAHLRLEHCRQQGTLHEMDLTRPNPEDYESERDGDGERLEHVYAAAAAAVARRRQQQPRRARPRRLQQDDDDDDYDDDGGSGSGSGSDSEDLYQAIPGFDAERRYREAVAPAAATEHEYRALESIYPAHSGVDRPMLRALVRTLAQAQRAMPLPLPLSSYPLPDAGSLDYLDLLMDPTLYTATPLLNYRYQLSIESVCLLHERHPRGSRTRHGLNALLEAVSRRIATVLPTLLWAQPKQRVLLAAAYLWQAVRRVRLAPDVHDALQRYTVLVTSRHARRDLEPCDVRMTGHALAAGDGALQRTLRHRSAHMLNEREAYASCFHALVTSAESIDSLDGPRPGVASWRYTTASVLPCQVAGAAAFESPDVYCHGCVAHAMYRIIKKLSINMYWTDQSTRAACDFMVDVFRIYWRALDPVYVLESAQ